MSETITVRVCDSSEYLAELRSFTGQGHVSFTQAPFYGAWQTADGKTVVYYVASAGSQVLAAGLAVLYTAPGGLSFLYSPYGPVTHGWTEELAAALRDFFEAQAKRLGSTFVRLDGEGLEKIGKPVSNKLAVTASLQPRAEWLLDISGDQDSVWMGMHKHARYNIRLAERVGAEVTLYAPADAPLDVFLDLMSTTARRDKFSTQTEQYYKAVLASLPAENGFVAVCVIDGKPAATAVFAAYDGVMHYVFAGSSDEFRKIAPPYFVIWQAILEAKKRGWQTLNFGGVTDDVKGRSLAGVTSFKKRFGGYEVTHPNPVDFVYKPLKYQTFKLYKQLRG